MPDNISPWSPVHHEDIADDPPPRKPSGAARQERSMSLPIGMTLQVPPELIRAVEAIAETQEKLVDAQADLADRVDGLASAMTDLAAEIRSAMTDQGKSMAGHMEQMGAHHEATGQTHQQALTDLRKQIGALQASILAPRRVTLERDKAGLATGAVSEIETPERMH